MLNLVVVHNHAILLGRSVAGRLDFHRDLIPLAHHAKTADVADKLPLLATGADDRKLVVNDHIEVVSVADEQPGIHASTIGVVGEEAELLQVGGTGGRNHKGREVRLSFTQSVTSLDHVLHRQPVGDSRAGRDGLVETVDGVQGAASAKQALHLRDKLRSAEFIDGGSHLLAEHFHGVFADRQLRQLVDRKRKASVSDGRVLRASGDLLEREVPLAGHAPVVTRGHPLLYRVERPEEGCLDPGAGRGREQGILSGDDAGLDHSRLQEDFFLQVLGELARRCKPRETCNVAGKSAAQVAKVGHWKESKGS